MTPTDLHEFLRSRRSIRHFLAKPVQREKLLRILETARYAPSAHNRQPWRFAVLTELSPKSRLSELMAADFEKDLLADGIPAREIDILLNRSKSRITESPVVIVLSMDLSEMDSYPDEKRSNAERLMAVQSTALAGLQLLQAAHAEGLGGVWTCGPLFSPVTVREALELPATWEPQAMFFIGETSETPREKSTKPLEQIVKFI